MKNQRLSNLNKKANEGYCYLPCFDFLSSSIAHISVFFKVHQVSTVLNCILLNDMLKCLKSASPWVAKGKAEQTGITKSFKKRTLWLILKEQDLVSLGGHTAGTVCPQAESGKVMALQSYKQINNSPKTEGTWKRISM